MEDASRVMYKIANVLNWILLVLCAVLFIFGIFFTANAASLASSGKYTMNDHVATADDITSAGIALIIVAVWLIIIDVLFIVFTRIAAKKESSQGWDSMHFCRRAGPNRICFRSIRNHGCRMGLRGFRLKDGAAIFVGPNRDLEGSDPFSAVWMI
jgi:uncharacterized membrane protein